MSKGLKFIINLSIWFAVISYIAVGVWFHSSKQPVYSGLEIKILDGQKFVDTAIVSSWLDTIVSGMEGKPLDRTAMGRMEKVLQNQPYVQEVDVFSDIDGRCVIELSQRDVVFRVLSEKGHDFFVDTLGFRLNPHGVWQKDVPVITTDCSLPFAQDEYGYVEGGFALTSNYYLKNLCKFVNVLQNNQFLGRFVTQTKITGELKPGREMVHLVPRFGRHRIVLGDLDDISEKLENVSAFYINAYKKGWESDASEVCFQYGDKIIVKKHIN